MDLKYKGILLDLDNTLYDYQKANKPAISALVAETRGYCDFDLTEISGAYEQGRHETHVRLKGTGAMHSRLLYIQRMCELLKIKGLQNVTTLHEYFWKVYFENMILFPGSLKWIEKCSKLVPICIVTDFTSDLQYKKLEHLKLDNYFTAMVSSEEAGIEKPARQIFELALEKLSLSPKEVCMVGDNYEKDILGAQEMGIDAIWLDVEDEDPNIKGYLPKGIMKIKDFSMIDSLLQ